MYFTIGSWLHKASYWSLIYRIHCASTILEKIWQKNSMHLLFHFKFLISNPKKFVELPCRIFLHNICLICSSSASVLWKNFFHYLLKLWILKLLCFYECALEVEERFFSFLLVWVQSEGSLCISKTIFGTFPYDWFLTIVHWSIKSGVDLLCNAII